MIRTEGTLEYIVSSGIGYVLTVGINLLFICYAMDIEFSWEMGTAVAVLHGFKILIEQNNRNYPQRRRRDVD